MTLVHIEVRGGQVERTDDERIRGVAMPPPPLVKISSSRLAQQIAHAQAVCFNGRWFLPLVDELGDKMEEEWRQLHR